MSDAAPRPTCAYCDRPLAKRTGAAFFKTTNQGDITHSTFWRSILVDALPRSKQEAQRHINEPIISVRRNEDGTVYRAGFWLGGYQAAHGRFCTDDCAGRFGRASYEAGYRIARPGTGKE